MIKRLILPSLFLAVSAVTAQAGFYVGASVTSTDSNLQAAGENFGSDETGWKAYLGWDFLSFLGAEAGYRDLGSFSDSSTEGQVAYDVKALDVAARAFLPIGRLFNLYGKAGFANIAWDGRIDLGDEIENFDEDNWELFYGLGVEFNLGDRFAVRAEWEKFDASDNLTTLSAGALFRF
jgi:OOP family OmpA-OmpF porin